MSTVKKGRRFETSIHDMFPTLPYIHTVYMSICTYFMYVKIRTYVCTYLCTYVCTYLCSMSSTNNIELFAYAWTYGGMEYNLDTEYTKIMHTYVCAFDNNYM